MFKKLGLALYALLAITGVAVAGAFTGFPIVGDPGNDICLSFGNPTSAVPCNQYSPIAPTTVPPLSTFPADTNVQGAGANSNPVTVNVPVGLTGATVLDNAPLTGASVAVPVGTAKLMLNPAGTIATLTVTLPGISTTSANGNVYTLNDGQTFSIYTSQTVTALTVTPASGTTLTPTITTVSAAAPVKLIYNGQAKAWQLF
jgi:hypothetical protein